MSDEKTHWKRLINPDYIGAYALPPGEDMTVTILSVQREKVTVTGGKKEDHTVARLKGQKPLILNATNQKSIARLYGPYIEDWAGKRITLFASTAKLAGETVECLRVRPQVSDKPKAAFKDSRLQEAIDAIKAGRQTFKKLSETYIFTLEQEDTIKQATEAQPEPAPQEQGESQC
jgi:hypothetical protein